MISWKSHFLYQLDYQHWASDQLFESLDKLSDEARKQDEGLFYKSIHGTINHMLVNSLVWSGRLKGESPDYRMDQQLFEDWRELKLAQKQTLRQMQHWLQAQAPEFFVEELRYTISSGKEHVNWVHDILTHFVTHSAHSRGQAIATGVRLGAPTADMDYLLYRRDMQDTLANSRQVAG
jgi:uncharacterized damage-inducible protein DinB